ncbi:MAG: [Fe-S]-binding protein [Candidatus Marinimicrobia bacterium]|nr:[Fe-S]-binding protein [Candidatus Neomarinimicrobiota bacterium]
MIYYSSLESTIGRLLLAKSLDGICKISLPTEGRNLFFEWLKNHFRGQAIVKKKEPLAIECQQLDNYFRGKQKIFNLNIDFKETNFRIKVLRMVATIPFGKTASYKQIAEKIKNPKSVRAVGSANTNNPIPIIIPCHRIISNDGKIGGYNGGVYLKNWLLEHESYHLLHSD